jgi:hypothetical protein
MPENLKQSEVNARTDPSVAKQFDNESSSEEKFKDFYTIADANKFGMFSTYRQGVGVSTQPINTSNPPYKSSNFTLTLPP